MKDTGIQTEPVEETSCQSCGHPLDVSGLPGFVEIACPECGAHQMVPVRLGGFLLLELIGRGGMGAVYRGLDTSLDRPVAVKVLLSALGEDREFVKTFRHEAQAAAALNHPNVVQIYSFGIAQGQPYMVMELLEGGRFDQLMAKSEPLSEALVLKVAADVAEGLNAAAAIGLIHGDVKPENILFDSNGVAKVVDFGLARFRKGDEPTVQGVWGTPYYIAPEKITGHTADARSDIYSLGATLFHALTGKPPFDGATPIDVVKARLRQPAPPLSQFRPTINPEIAGLVARMLETDPLMRHPTYASVLSDIRRVLPTLQPAPGLTAAVSKRGSKIVLVKKKGAGGGAVPLAVRASRPSLTSSTHQELSPEAQARLQKKRRRRRIVWTVILSVLAGGLAIGGAIWGVLFYKGTQALRAAALREQAILAGYRTQADAAWTALLASVSNAEQSVAKSDPLVVEADAAKTEIAAALPALSGNALFADTGSNLEVLVKTVTGTVADEFQTAVGELYALTNTVGSNRAIVAKAVRSGDAEAAAGALTNVVPRTEELNRIMAVSIEKATAASKNLQELRKKVAGAAADQQALAARRAQDEAEAARRAQEAAAAERKAKEHAELVERELKQVDDARKANSTLVQQNQFKKAADALAAAVAGVSTEEGKKACKLAADRYKMLEDLKTFLIARIQAEAKANPEGFKYGWLVNNVPSRDVLGADDAKVLIRGGAVPWDQVIPAQMIRFVKHYAADPNVDRREAAGQWLAGAIYAYEAGAGSERATRLASELKEEAGRLSSAIEEQAKRYLSPSDKPAP